MWKHPNCPLTDERISKMWYTCIQWSTTVLKRKENLTHATTCMNFEDIRLSEISQSQKDKDYMISLPAFLRLKEFLSAS